MPAHPASDAGEPARNPLEASTAGTPASARETLRSRGHDLLSADPAAGALALRLAREAVERYLRTGELLEPGNVLPALRRPGGVFVTLRARGQLRGCIGTLFPTRPDLAREIVANAVAAATQDPRFLPVRLDELPALRYEVDVVGPLERVSTEAALDPRVYGVVVAAESRRGVLLPDLEGVDTVAQQLAIARRKAGLPPDSPVSVYRFRVDRFVEPP